MVKILQRHFIQGLELLWAILLALLLFSLDYYLVKWLLNLECQVAAH